MDDGLQEKMLQEMKDLAILNQARRYAFDYLDSVPERNVYPTDTAIQNLDAFEEEMPGESGAASEVLRQLDKIGSPGTVTHTGGRYFGFVTGGVLPVSLASRWLADVWDQNTALYVMSPVSPKLEEITEAWLRDLLGFSDSVVAGFVSGSSMALFCGLAAARYRLLKNQNWDINQKGFMGAPKVRIVTGRQIHGSVIKAIALLGFGIETIEWVDCDAQGRIIPSRTPDLDEHTILILQAGNVNSGSFDPFDGICNKANAANAWVHIDGAFGLWAAGSKRLNHLTKGMEKAHSWSVDGHKTLNTPYDNGIVLCSDREALVQSLQASGSYLSFSEQRDGMLYTPEMSRRSRVIELWAALKYLGKKGVDELVYGFHERAVQMAVELQAEEFRILNDVVFNQVLVSCETDDATRRTLTHLQHSGECWAGEAEWNGKAVIRISVCSWATTKEDITRSVREFVRARKCALQG